MKFETIVAPTITELFERQIQSAILSGKMAIGEKLPTEQVLADSMNVSKSIVHIGIKNLERMGFVHIVPRHGIYVANYPEEGNIDTLLALLKTNDGKLDPNTVKSLLVARQGLEGISIRLLAENHTEEQMEKLRKLLDNLRSAALSPEPARTDELAELLFQYHRYITAADGNNVSPMIINAFHDVIVVFWEAWIREISIEQMIHVEEQLMDLIKEGKGEKASDLLFQTMQKFLDKPENFPQANALN